MAGDVLSPRPTFMVAAASAAGPEPRLAPIQVATDRDLNGIPPPRWWEPARSRVLPRVPDIDSLRATPGRRTTPPICQPTACRHLGTAAQAHQIARRRLGVPSSNAIHYDIPATGVPTARIASQRGTIAASRPATGGNNRPIRRPITTGPSAL